MFIRNVKDEIISVIVSLPADKFLNLKEKMPGILSAGHFCSLGLQ